MVRRGSGITMDSNHPPEQLEHGGPTPEVGEA